MNTMERYHQWCTDPYFDEATRAELKALEEQGQTEEINDRFYRELPLAPAACEAFWAPAATV